MNSRITEIEKQIAYLQKEKEVILQKEAEESLLHEDVRKFKKTYSGAKLLEKYSLDTNGLWEVRGEDPNCDMGGHHSKPHLGYFDGKLEDVIITAVNLKGFYSWGSGGEITKVEKILITKL